jgi:hypothetical protein
MKQKCLVNAKEDEKGIAGQARNDRSFRMKKAILSISAVAAIGIAIINSSCIHQSTTQLNNVVLTKVTETDMFGDSTYFSQIMSMFWAETIYIPDYKRDQIIEVDTMNQVINTIGSRGSGPGELLGASNLFVKNDTIYIINESKQCFEIFDKTQYIGSIRSPGLFGDRRFSVVDGNIICASLSEHHSLKIINTRKDSVFFFGNLSERGKKYNGKHIWTDERFIYAISELEPIIDRYLFNGEFVDKYDFRNIEPIKTLMTYSDRNLPQNSYRVLVPDVYMYKDLLYLLIVTRDGDKSNCNTLLVINVKKMEAVKLITLNERGSWFESFCVKDNILIAFNLPKASLLKFQLP